MPVDGIQKENNEDLRSRRFATKEVRRQQLIEATLQVVAEKGVSGTTMTAVTGTAGLSTGIVSLHFNSKDNLLNSTLEYLAIEFRDRWKMVANNNAIGSAQKVWGIMETNFDPEICTPEKIRVWFAFFGEARYRGVYREIVKSFDEERGDVLDELFEELGFPEEECDELTEAIESLADGLWLGMMLYPEWVDSARIKRQIWSFLSLNFPQHFPPDAKPSMASVK